MASVNRVMLLGNLTRDVELRYTPSGKAVTDVGVAVNDRSKDNDGKWVETPTFIECTLWGRTAEVAKEYLSKGSPIFLEGRLKLEQWEADGEKRSRLKVVGERMQMLPSKVGNGKASGNGKKQAASNAAEQANAEVANTGAQDAAPF